MNKLPCALVLAMCALVFSSNTVVTGTVIAGTVVAGTDSTQVSAGPEWTPTLSLDPPYIETAEGGVGQNVTIGLLVKNVAYLYGVQFGLVWDPNALECLDLNLTGEFLGDTLSIAGTINNTAGEIYPPCGITRINPYEGGIPRSPSSGILANATFKTKALGRFNVYLSEVSLLGARMGDLQCLPMRMYVDQVFEVGVRPYELLPGVYFGLPKFHEIVMTTNCTNPPQTERTRLYDYTFDARAREIRFRVVSSPYYSGTDPNDPTHQPKKIFFPRYCEENDTSWTGGSCNVTIPVEALRAAEGGWKVRLNGTETPYTETVLTFLKFIEAIPAEEGGEEDAAAAEEEIWENVTVTILSFNFTLGNYEVKITGDAVGKNSYTLPFTAVIVAAVASVAAVAVLWRKGLLRRR